MTNYKKAIENAKTLNKLMWIKADIQQDSPRMTWERFEKLIDLVSDKWEELEAQGDVYTRAER